MNAASKFKVWLGDGWPGPYLVTVIDHRARRTNFVVQGVSSLCDAVTVAESDERWPANELIAEVLISVAVEIRAVSSIGDDT